MYWFGRSFTKCVCFILKQKRVIHVLLSKRLFCLIKTLLKWPLITENKYLSRDLQLSSVTRYWQTYSMQLDHMQIAEMRAEQSPATLFRRRLCSVPSPRAPSRPNQLWRRSTTTPHLHSALCDAVAVQWGLLERSMDAPRARCKDSANPVPGGGVYKKFW